MSLINNLLKKSQSYQPVSENHLQNLNRTQSLKFSTSNSSNKNKSFFNSFHQRIEEEDINGEGNSNRNDNNFLTTEIPASQNISRTASQSQHFRQGSENELLNFSDFLKSSDDFGASVFGSLECSAVGRGVVSVRSCDLVSWVGWRFLGFIEVSYKILITFMVSSALNFVIL